MPILSNHSTTYVQNQLEAPMPWIGMYVALASLTCPIAMVADIFHGLRTKKLWLPCKYFSLNATTLALLAVAMKLPVDLTTNMWAVTDRLAKLSSLALMSTATGNFLPSIGSMGDKEILINVTALGILIITVIVDVCIQVVETRSFLHQRVLFLEETLAMSLMLILLVLLCSSAIMVLTTKRYLEAKYQEMHNVALRQQFLDMGAVTTHKLTDLVKKYWLMAETGSPQFVIARSVICAASGVICLINALLLAEAHIRMAVVHKRFSLTASSYGFSTNWILLAQTIGVLVGTISPAFRWCTAISLRCSSSENRSLKDEFKIEAYWTRKLEEIKRNALASPIRHRRIREFLHNTKGLVLNFLVGIQISIVLSSKLVLVISSCIIVPFISLFQFIKHLKMRQRVDSIPRQVNRESGSDSDMGLHVKRHSLRLQGEAELSENTLKSICKEVDKVIDIGRWKKLKDLLQLLQQKSGNLQGVVSFDANQVESLHSKEPPNCWSLPVVTLTSIAIALPNIPKEGVNQLVSSVSEGLFCIKLIEKCLNRTGDLKNIRKAAADTWVRVELSRKWQKMDLCEISGKSKNSEETLQKLSDEGKKIVNEFKRTVKDCLMRNPLNWPAKVIAANSMYRISQTLLLFREGDNDQTDGELFDQLSVMIADILAACLTNLTRVITTKCHQNAIEDREKSVHQAALLLGQTEEILEFLRQTDAEQAAYIDEWRALMQLEEETLWDAISLSSSEMATPEPGGDHVAITVMEESFQCLDQNCHTIEEIAISFDASASTSQVTEV